MEFLLVLTNSLVKSLLICGQTFFKNEKGWLVFDKGKVEDDAKKGANFQNRKNSICKPH